MYHRTFNPDDFKWNLLKINKNGKHGQIPVFRSKEVEMTSFFVAQSDANRSK